MLHKLDHKKLSYSNDNPAIEHLSVERRDIDMGSMMLAFGALAMKSYAARSGGCSREEPSVYSFGEKQELAKNASPSWSALKIASPNHSTHVLAALMPYRRQSKEEAGRIEPMAGRLLMRTGVGTKIDAVVYTLHSAVPPLWC